MFSYLKSMIFGGETEGQALARETEQNRVHNRGLHSRGQHSQDTRDPQTIIKLNNASKRNQSAHHAGKGKIDTCKII